MRISLEEGCLWTSGAIDVGFVRIALCERSEPQKYLGERSEQWTNFCARGGTLGNYFGERSAPRVKADLSEDIVLPKRVRNTFFCKAWVVLVLHKNKNIKMFSKRNVFVNTGIMFSKRKFFLNIFKKKFFP